MIPPEDKYASLILVSRFVRLSIMKNVIEQDQPSQEQKLSTMHELEEPGALEELIAQKRIPDILSMTVSALTASLTDLPIGTELIYCFVPPKGYQQGDKARWKDDAPYSGVMEFVTPGRWLRGNATKYSLTLDQAKRLQERLKILRATGKQSGE